MNGVIRYIMLFIILFNVLLYASNECGNVFYSTSLSSGTPIAKSDSVSNGNSDNFYFTTPGAGTVAITLSNIQDDKVRFTVNTAGCPNTSGNKTNQTITLSSSDTDFNIKVYRTTNFFDWGNSNKTYTLTVTYTASSGAVVNTSERNFVLRSANNIKGNVAVIGNTVLCVKGGSGCQDYTGGDSNAELDLMFIDVDNTNRTYNNSSKAMLNIPSGAVVKWAAIYTQGYLQGNNQATVENTLKENVYVTLPNIGTIVSTPTVVDMLPNDSTGYTYETFAPLNELVGKTGSEVNGLVTGANIKANTGTEWSGLGNFGAWTLVVVYEYSGESLRNISVFDGYKKVADEGGHRTVEIPVSGFLTPTAGNVKSTLSIFVGEGDKNIDGDKLYLNNIAINDTNAFYSTLSGIAASPSYQNTQGIDIQNHAVGKDNDASHKQIIGNSQTSATIKLTSTQDTYFPSVAVFSTELYSPDVCYEETITRAGSPVSGEVDIGDILDFEVRISNSGNQVAKGVSIQKKYDGILAFVLDSMHVKNINEAIYKQKTDDPLDDTASYDSINNVSTYYLGADSNSNSGGNISKGENVYFKYQMSVADYINRSIENTYFVSYKNEQINQTFSGIAAPKCVAFTNIINIKNPNKLIQCGLFPDALNSGTKITIQNSKTTINGSGTSITTPSLNNNNNNNPQSTCDAAICTANGNKPASLTLPAFYQSSATDSISLSSNMTLSAQNLGYLTASSSNSSAVSITFSAPYSSPYGGNVMFIKSLTSQSNKDITYVFNEGDYWIDSSTFDSSAKVTIQTNGKVRFFLNGGFRIQNSTQFEMLSNGGNAYVFVYGDINFLAGKSVNIDGVFMYATGAINIQNATSFTYTGAITAQGDITILVGNGATFNYGVGTLTADGYADCVSAVINYSFNAWESTGDINSKNIYTKLSGKDFALNIVALDDNGALKNSDAIVKVSVVNEDDALSYTPEQEIALDNTSMKSATFNVSNASKKAKIKIVNKDTTASKCTIASPCYSTDTFSIRPASFSATKPTSAFVAGATDNKLTIKAVDANDANSMGYNQTSTKLTPSIKEWLKFDNSVNNTTPNASPPLTFANGSFTNGESTDSALSFSDVGRFNIYISDSDWTSVDKDVGDCVAGSYSNTATNGKIGCDINSTAVDIRFKPHHFALSNVGIMDFGGGFTYLGADAPNSAYVLADIVAQNVQNETTKNYAGGGLYERAITVTPTLNKTGTPTVSSFFAASTSVLGFGSGTYKMDNKLRLNFNKNIATTLDPVNIATADATSDINLKISDEDSVSGEAKTGENGKFQTTTAHFLYGRLRMPSAMVDDKDAGMDVRAYAEVYATDIAKLPTGTWILSSGTSNWWVNKLDVKSSLSNAYMRQNDTLALSNEAGSITTTVPIIVSTGTATMNIKPTKNIHEKLTLQLDVQP